MNCPECNEKAIRRGGGSSNNSAYYACQDCDIVFSVKGGVTKVVEHQPVLFRDRREACRVLYQAVKDDRTWFGNVSEETEAIARLVWQDYLLKNKKKAPAAPGRGISFGFGWRRAA